MNRNVDDLPDQPLDPGGGPIVFTGERRFIVVESGVLELRLAAPDRAGAALPFARVGAGGLAGMLGTPTDPVLAWPERGTRLRQWQPDAPAAHEIPGPLWLALEDWIAGLSRGATVDVGESRLPSETITTVPDGVVLRPPHGVAWLEVLAGRLEYADAPSFFAEAVPGQPAVVITPAAGAGVRAVGTVEVRLRIPADLLVEDTFWPAIDRFHAASLSRIGRQLRDDESNLTRRLDGRKFAERRSLAAALAILVDPNEDAVSVHADPLVAAIARVARAQGESPSLTAPLSPTVDPHQSVLVAAEAMRLRARRIRLEPDWWRTLEEPLLGFLAEGSSPVALLPSRPSLLRRRRGTITVVGADGSRRIIASVTAAATLQATAYSLNPSLPDGPITTRDLVRFGLRTSRRELVTITMVTVLGGLLGLATPVATGILFDSIIPTSVAGELHQIVAALLAAAIGAAVFGFVRSYAVLRLSTHTNARLEAAIWDRLLRLPADFFRGRPAADLALRADALNRMREAVDGIIIGATLAALFGILNFVLLIYYGGRLAWIAAGLALVQASLLVAVSLVQIRLQRRLLEVGSQSRTVSLELIEMINKLKAAAAEERGFARFAKLFAEQSHLRLRMALLAGGLGAFGAGWAILSVGALIAGVGFGWTEIGLGDYAAFSAAFGQFTAAIVSLTGVLPAILGLIPLYERAKLILETAPEETSGRDDPGPLQGSIEVQGVTFRYGPGLPVILRDVSIRANPGEFVAVVGPSGSGKSTLVRLLLGFAQPEAGIIAFDGRDLARLDRRAVRRQLGVVLQRGTVMSGSLLENIGSGTPLSLDEAMTAARAAGLAADIADMPMGLHTLIADGGGTLSGGQRQRLMIARALARRPRILVLDEATSALDNRTQEIVTESLEAMGITRIVVAHRLSTVQHADRIFVMEGGSVVEEGRFDELIARGGLFSQLAARQLV
jgi:NHLM bacteriocin system ABC transporter ATP-binding protein